MSDRLRETDIALDDFKAMLRDLDHAINAYKVRLQIIDRAVVNLLATNPVIRELLKLFAKDGKTGKGLVMSLVKQEFNRLTQEPFMELML